MLLFHSVTTKRHLWLTGENSNERQQVVDRIRLDFDPDSWGEQIGCDFYRLFEFFSAGFALSALEILVFFTYTQQILPLEEISISARLSFFFVRRLQEILFLRVTHIHGRRITGLDDRVEEDKKEKKNLAGRRRDKGKPFPLTADWNIRSRRSNKWPEDTTVTEAAGRERNISPISSESKAKQKGDAISLAPMSRKENGSLPSLSPRQMPLCAQSSIRHVTRYYSCSDGQGRRFLEDCHASYLTVHRPAAALLFDVPL
ncbi:hypothetical protein AVEN_212869-1 [Araneus ventricosus]|uniref:Uncharacterized protein n=1 Tax=Araneus ventricosus TaxID=182803 RepID=A0A4Y2F7F4_ARAVE|nr:hypothetical protein AVEN_212869-1 [Araneus ventricosus]